MKFFAKAKVYDDVTTLDDSDLICYCCSVDKMTIVNATKNGATTLKAIKEATSACTGNECKELNPNKRCCSKEIHQLIKVEATDV